jgi:LuxR family maltose regulon positive regulatory protein
LRLAERASASVSAGRSGQFQVLLGVVRLLHARQRGDPRAVLDEAGRLRATAEAPEAAQPGLGEELRALAVQAIELAERHGWTDEPAAGIAYRTLGAVLAWQGRPEEAEPWVQRAERTVTAEAEPAAWLAVYYTRGWLELVRGRDADALAAFRGAERLAGRLAAPHLLVARARAMQVYILVRLGDTERAGHVLAGFGGHDRDRTETGIATAVLRLAQDDPEAAAAALAPVFDDAPSVHPWGWLARAFLLEASARDALGDPGAAGRALERALDLIEPDGMLSLFLLHPAPALLERQVRYGTSHAALIAEARACSPETGPARRPPGRGRCTSR